MTMLFVWQGLFFITTQILGLAVALRVQELIPVEQIHTPHFEIWKFLLIFAVATAGMIFAMRLPRGRGWLLRTFFIIAVWWGGSLTLSVWMPDIVALFAMSVAIIIWLRWTRVFLHNILVILGISGIASVFGLRFSPDSVVILLIIFAVYDVIAVYKTKHMVSLARSMLEFRALFAVIAPEKFPKFLARMRDVAPGQGFMMLGGGDLAFPLMLASSVAIDSLVGAFIIVGFSFIGLAASLTLFLLLGRKPMPALPPIALFSIIGYLITKLII